ncbi:hypothetical protein NDU88_002648 [Pleurodeles waltl]|uniref:Uncharacterized protein n=1 Tax=Pleurodeles waltl TaxID=8319 RepID=A0AAV7W3N9_PLEWA|nr:hypothetical protein NDU88_002648 [Pleurodeles waltl]
MGVSGVGKGWTHIKTPTAWQQGVTHRGDVTVGLKRARSHSTSKFRPKHTTDMRKVPDKVTTDEGNIAELQGEVSPPKRQIAQITTVTGELERRAEDAQSCFCCSNICILGVAQKGESGSYRKVPRGLGED